MAAVKPREIFLYEIGCHWPHARLVASKFSTIVLGGTAALHTYRMWGAVIFVVAALLQRDEIAAIVIVVGRVIAQRSYHFVVVLWRAKEAQSKRQRITGK